MDKKPLLIPAGVAFAELELEREPFTKILLFRPEPLAVLFRANAIELSSLVENEDLVCWVISQWYLEHRTAGGAQDPVAEEILAEVAMLQASDIPSLQPGGQQEP